METTFPFSQYWGWLFYTSANGIGSIVLPMQGTGPALPSDAPGGRQGQFYHHSDLMASSPTCLGC